jgi:5'-nucleotidase
MAHFLLKKELPRDTFLNINVPNLDEERVRSYRITKQGRWTHNGNAVIEKVDPRGGKYYWIGSEDLIFEKSGETDFEAVSNSYISITPLHCDLTNHSTIQELKKWRL